MNAIQWFEIPALDLERAFAFYHQVTGGHVRKGTFGQDALVLFDVPFQSGEAVGGSLVVRPDLTPTTAGPVLYLNAFGSLQALVQRVVPAGGQVVVAEMDLGKFGFASIIIDSEGNKVGFLSHEK